MARVYKPENRPGLYTRLGSGHGWIQQLLCSLDSEYRKQWIREQADLFEYRGLIPVDAFMCQLSVTEANDNHEWNLYAPMRRGHARKHPRHLFGVREGKDNFVD